MAQARVVHGPGRRGAQGPKPRLENSGALLKRLFGFVSGFVDIYGELSWKIVCIIPPIIFPV